jgi:hypothetical protein
VERLRHLEGFGQSKGSPRLLHTKSHRLHYSTYCTVYVARYKKTTEEGGMPRYAALSRPVIILGDYRLILINGLYSFPPLATQYSIPRGKQSHLQSLCQGAALVSLPGSSSGLSAGEQLWLICSVAGLPLCWGAAPPLCREQLWPLCWRAALPFLLGSSSGLSAR